MSEKLLVPKIRFKEFTNAWEQWKVGDLLTERLEFSKQTIDFPLMAFIANEGITPKGKRYDRSSLVKDAENKIYKVTKYGDFIYSSNNLDRGSIGSNKYGNACISPVYSVFRTTNLSNSQFIEKALCRNELIDKILRYRQGVVYGQLKIHESAFLNINLSSPTLPEQNKIGRLLANLDSLITLHQRKLSILKNLKNRLLDRMFCDEKSQFPSIRFKEFTNAWEQEKLGNLVDIFSGKLDTKDAKPNGTYNFYTCGYEIYKIDSYAFEGEGITISGSGSTVGNLHLADGKYNANQRTYVIQNIKIPRYYIYSYMTNNFISYCERSSKSSGIPNIDTNTIFNFVLPITNVEEQSKISSLFSHLDSLIALHQRKLNSLKNIKNTLLEKMFV
ncbi:Type I restriction modification system specificity (S) subunit, HsdS [Mycoplasmopsis agalactiae 14628]|uniref:Type I restriction modification system specificity (S) subunit, HsdS n=1 Tax=Mycoplasmopsis agalactiae 14628 TaxID=1110504 RepID=I5D6J8_MYCAA|nr:restriction endonuclease subunit S [Mycoplasmopsis agalactiae]EIN15307.1 Type I restriction modification system specificity (S) subunit, HsdS [Mycoplasmopsis agalactiae 14628]